MKMMRFSRIYLIKYDLFKIYFEITPLLYDPKKSIFVDYRFYFFHRLLRINMKLRKTVIIVAGGTGERMNANIPKQFLSLDGKPILIHTLEKFHQYSDDIKIILVLPFHQIDFWSEICIKYNFTLPHQIVVGGNARFYSVKNALETISDDCLVAIHDGVRPLVAIDTIARCFDKAEKTGTAIPVIELVDSIREVSDTTSAARDRKKYKLVQTPQIFTSEILLKSYHQPYSDFFTDDASVVESAGYKINLVEGNLENIKITTPFDLKMAGFFISKNK